MKHWCIVFWKICGILMILCARSESKCSRGSSGRRNVLNTYYSPSPSEINFQQDRRGEKVYSVRLTKVSWFEAVIQCQCEGKRLATTVDENEHKKLVEVLNKFGPKTFDSYSYNGLWLGLTDLAKAMQFTWITGQPMTFKNWAPEDNQPDNMNNNEYCVEIRHQYNRFVWNDLDCSKPRYYVCESV